jgi:putative SOS response-associated peptidase YedK
VERRSAEAPERRGRTVAAMCGRYATTRSDPDLAALFDAVTITAGPGPSWNVAPTDPVPVVRNSTRHAARVVDTARWGLVPPWATDPRAGARMINARAETVADSPAFAPSFARRRCLIPADGWYEWIRDGKRRQAYYMTTGGFPLAFAGLWSSWGPDGMLTCSIVTTPALGALARVHDRMPLVLPAERWTSWLAGGGDPYEQLAPMSLAELAAIEVRPVGAAVGNVRNNGPELVEAAVPEPTLF